MATVRSHTWRMSVGLRRRNVRPSSIRRSTPTPDRTRPDAQDRLLAPLRRHRLWTVLGLLVATVAAATRFAAIGVVPPSITLKPFAHARGSTEVVVGESRSFRHSVPDHYGSVLSARAYALADIVASPELARYVARAAGVPASKIGILGPLWTDLWRSQQWAPGPKRASQILIEHDPYHITLNVETNSPPWPPVIDVETQAPNTQSAARLATAVVSGLQAYVLHLQTAIRVPQRERYDVSQLVPVSVTPARTSQLADVGALTFVAVFVLWCGVMVAVSSLIRDVRVIAADAKVGSGVDRSSGSRPQVAGPTDA